MIRILKSLIIKRYEYLLLKFETFIWMLLNNQHIMNSHKSKFKSSLNHINNQEVQDEYDEYCLPTGLYYEVDLYPPCCWLFDENIWHPDDEKNFALGSILDRLYPNVARENRRVELDDDEPDSP